MLTIYKYPFKIEDNFKIAMPKNAKILAVAIKDEIPCIWAMVETYNDLALKEFWLRGTGHNCEEIRNLSYVGSFQILGGSLVFHLFTK